MSLDRAFAALADPTRRELLRRLAAGPRPAGELAGTFPISRPAVSKHLRALRQAGLVRARREGRQRLYRLSPEGLREARAWMEEAARAWDAALEAYRRRAEEAP